MSVLYNYWFVVMWIVAMFGIVTKGQEVMELGPCGEDRVFEIANNTAGNNLIFRYDNPFRERVQWTLITSRGQRVNIGYCYTHHLDCYAENPTVLNLTLLSAQMNEAVSMTLTVSTLEKSYNLSYHYFDSGTSLFRNSTVLGYTYDPGIYLKCTTDFVELAQAVSCSGMYSTSTSPWSIISRCDVTKVYSAMGRYSCRLFSKLTAAELGKAVAMTTTAIKGAYYVSGACIMTSSFPAVDGNYTYFVEILPGRRKYDLKFERSEVYKPIAPRLSHNCPAYVMEGSSLDCTCVTSDPGSPPAVLNWSTTPSEHLVLSNVQRNDEGLTLTCLMTWGGAVVTSVNYTLFVTPDAQAAFIRGLGVGLGVGVALLVTAVVVVVVLLWRRGWTLALPCRRSKSHSHDVIETRQTNTELSLPDDHGSGGSKSRHVQEPASLYEALDVNKIGVTNTYEGLMMTPAKPTNTKRAKRKTKKGGKFAAESSRGHDNPAMDGEEGLKTQKRTRGAGVETYENASKIRDKSEKTNNLSHTTGSESFVYCNA